MRSKLLRGGNKTALPFILLFLVSCSHTGENTRGTFSGLEESDIGRSLRVDGYLVFDSQNQNLYPTENWRRDLSRALCIPVRVDAADQQLGQRVSSMSGRRVSIEGIVSRLLEGREVNGASCRRIGMHILRISE